MGLIDHNALTPEQTLAFYITATLEVASQLEDIYSKPGVYIAAVEDGTLHELADCLGESLTIPVMCNSNNELAEILSHFIESFMRNSQLYHTDSTSKQILWTPAAEIVLTMSEEINEDVIMRVQGKDKLLTRLKELELTDLVNDMERVIQADKSENKTEDLLNELEQMENPELKVSDIFK